MIVYSCNVVSDAQIKSVIADVAPQLRISDVYRWLGCNAKCGRCVATIRSISRKLGTHSIALATQ
jgi:bacterioferritin-associated ferredoxin